MNNNINSSSSQRKQHLIGLIWADAGNGMYLIDFDKSQVDWYPPTPNHTHDTTRVWGSGGVVEWERMYWSIILGCYYTQVLFHFLRLPSEKGHHPEWVFVVGDVAVSHSSSRVFGKTSFGDKSGRKHGKRLQRTSPAARCNLNKCRPFYSQSMFCLGSISTGKVNEAMNSSWQDV